MRLRTFVAPSMAQVMAQVREAFGEDAIIVSNEQTDTGIRIVAAIEEHQPEIEETAPFGVSGDSENPYDGLDPIDVVHEGLLQQGVPTELLDRLIEASFMAGVDDPREALTDAVSRTFQFRPLQEQRLNQPLMLIGTPGCGKTVTIAKLAARAVFAHRKVRLITTDIVRAGAIEQLGAFARLMKLPLHTVETDRQLARVIAAAAPDEMVLIDTQGVNPFSNPDMAELSTLTKAAAVEIILVMGAATNCADSIDHARNFAQLGVSRLLFTQLDLVHRYGAMLAAADATRLPFCEFSMTPTIHEGLTVIDSSRLASLLLPQPARALAPAPATRGQIS